MRRPQITLQASKQKASSFAAGLFAGVNSFPMVPCLTSLVLPPGDCCDWLMSAASWVSQFDSNQWVHSRCSDGRNTRRRSLAILCAYPEGHSPNAAAETHFSGCVCWIQVGVATIGWLAVWQAGPLHKNKTNNPYVITAHIKPTKASMHDLSNGHHMHLWRSRIATRTN